MNEQLNTGFLVANSHTGHWFYCATAEEADAISYGYRFDDASEISSQAELIHALAHVAIKPWFDASKFFDCIRNVE